ncbi:MAG: hypothetical protein WBA93_28685 [Microcoleaceae cyanobacterium]
MNSPFNGSSSMSIFSPFGNMQMNSPLNGSSSMSIFSPFGSTLTNSNQTSISNSNTNNNSLTTSFFSTTNTVNNNSSTTTIIDESYSDVYLDHQGQDILTEFIVNEPPVTNNNFDPITGEIIAPDLTQDEPLIPDTSNQEAPIHTFYINGVNNTLADYQNTIPLVNNLLTATGINSQVEEETYNLSGKPKPINFDFAQSIIQAVTSGNDFEGTQFTNNVVKKIQNIDQGNSLEDKFLIVAHSQGNFFAEDVFNQLPGSIQERTRILAFSPFTNFPGISSDKFDYLLREDDFPNRLKNLPAIAVPEDQHNLPSWPGNYLQSLFPGDRNSHKIENYLDINQYPQGSQEDNLVEESFEQAKVKIQELLDFNSGIYQEEQTIDQGFEDSDSDSFFGFPTQYNNDAFAGISNFISEGSNFIFGW